MRSIIIYDNFNLIILVGGIYHCIHSITEGSTTFLSIWNDDDGATQPFSCFVSYFYFSPNVLNEY
jgi:hypothetical protein